MDSIIGQSNYSYMFEGGLKNIPEIKNQVLTKNGNERMMRFCEKIGLQFLEPND